MNLKVLTAEEARDNYVEKNYLASLEDVAAAIASACEHSHEVVVNIPTGIHERWFSSAYYVAKYLSKLGYDVVTIHDNENGSSELTIKW